MVGNGVDDGSGGGNDGSDDGSGGGNDGRCGGNDGSGNDGSGGGNDGSGGGNGGGGSSGGGNDGSGGNDRSGNFIVILFQTSSLGDRKLHSIGDSLELQQHIKAAEYGETYSPDFSGMVLRYVFEVN